MSRCRRAVRAARLLGLTAVITGALSGCGSSTSAPIASASATQLRQDVRSIRAAVFRHDSSAARAAVTTLQADITELTTRGRLSRADAQVLNREARQVLPRLPKAVKPAAHQVTPTTATQASPAPAAPPGPPGHGGGHGKAKGKAKPNGKGNGKGGGDGGD